MHDLQLSELINSAMQLQTLRNTYICWKNNANLLIVAEWFAEKWLRLMRSLARLSATDAEDISQMDELNLRHCAEKTFCNTKGRSKGKAKRRNTARNGFTTVT